MASENPTNVESDCVTVGNCFDNSHGMSAATLATGCSNTVCGVGVAPLTSTAVIKLYTSSDGDSGDEVSIVVLQ